MNKEQLKKVEFVSAEIFALVALVVMVGYLIWKNVHHG